MPDDPLTAAYACIRDTLDVAPVDAEPVGVAFRVRAGTRRILDPDPFERADAIQAAAGLEPVESARAVDRVIRPTRQLNGVAWHMAHGGKRRPSRGVRGTTPIPSPVRRGRARVRPELLRV